MKQLMNSLGSHRLLNRILGEPKFVTIIQNLDAFALGKLIQHIGLEDAGEIIALATTDQLKKIFDEDLWKNEKPGQSEKFDAARFGLWLEIMFEAGTDFVLQKLMEMDEDFLTLAICCQIWVIDLQEIEFFFSNRRSRSFGQEDLLEKALESSLSQEFERFLIVSKRHETWDTVLSCLISMDRDHHDFLIRLLERCCYLSTEQIEDEGGLYQALTAEEQLESDVSGSREERREGEGFVPPQTAKSFLSLARQSLEQRDFITPHYFRNYESGKMDSSPKSGMHFNPTHSIQKEKLDALHQLLEDAQVLNPSQNILLLGSTHDDLKYQKIRSVLTELEAHHPIAFSQRMNELGYLSNILISGCSIQGRRFRSAEAAEAVLATCELGLELSHEPSKKILDQSMVHLFRLGWNALHQNVSLSCATQIEAYLEVYGHSVNPLDPWNRKQILQVAKTMKISIQQGTPWKSRDQFDILEIIFDQEKVQMLKDLIDECPTFQRQFLSSLAQLQDVSSTLVELLR